MKITILEWEYAGNIFFNVEHFGGVNHLSDLVAKYFLIKRYFMQLFMQLSLDQ